MGINIEKMELDTAKEMAGSLKYASIQTVSGYSIGKASGFADINEKETMDARFFSESEEIRFFRKNNCITAVKISDGDAEYIDENVALGEKFSTVGRFVTVRKYLEADEDGQMFVSATRLVDIKEE